MKHPRWPDREWPAWHVAPYVSVWAIESATSPDSVGWWVICGDGPTDYIPGEEGVDPREAVRAFAAPWSEVASYMLRAEPHPTIELGSPKTWPELEPLLKNRAELLNSCAADDSVWQPAPNFRLQRTGRSRCSQPGR
jgi:Domain of unknown function (DUF4826)